MKYIKIYEKFDEENEDSIWDKIDDEFLYLTDTEKIRLEDRSGYSIEYGYKRVGIFMRCYDVDKWHDTKTEVKLEEYLDTYDKIQLILQRLSKYFIIINPINDQDNIDEVKMNPYIVFTFIIKDIENTKTEGTKTLILTERGEHPLITIRVIKDFFDIGLKECKDIIDKARDHKHGIIASGVPIEKAYAIRKCLEKINGVKVSAV